MSKSAAAMSTTLSEEKQYEPSVDATDQIAELLAGENESEEEDESSDESQTDLSNLTDDESNELSDAAEDEGEEGEEPEKLELEGNDDEPTWGSTLGIDEEQLSFDDDGNFKGVITKVNGESEILPLKDLIAGYQVNKAVTTKGQQLAEERKAFDATKEQAQQIYVSKLESVDALAQHFEKQLIAEYDNVDWNRLRSEDPAEYAAAKADYSVKATELQRIQEAISQDKQASAAESQKTTMAAQQAFVKQQFETMLEKNPEWRDEKVRNNAKGEFKTFLNDTYGFNEQEFESVFDARLIELIKDAKRFHEAAKVSSKKRQKPVPKFQKSVGGKKKPAASKLDKLTAASRNAHGTEKRELQKSAVAELLIGNT